MISGIFVLLFGAWLGMSLRIVREDQRAIKVFLGRPGKTKESGLRFVWWPFQRLVPYTTKQQEVEIPARSVITLAGVYSGISYGAATINVQPVFYFFWPSDLRMAIKKGPNPQNREQIKDFFEETVADAIRMEAAKITWRECTQDRASLAAKVERALVASGPFREAGINNIRVVIKEIDLPDTLQTAITEPEVARLRAEATVANAKAAKEAAILQGQGQKEALKSVGEGEAAARKAIFDVAAEKGVVYEALLTLREMAKGTSNTILFGLPPQLNDMLSHAMGGRAPEDILRMLTPEQQRALIDWITTKKGETK